MEETLNQRFFKTYFSHMEENVEQHSKDEVGNEKGEVGIMSNLCTMLSKNLSFAHYSS